MNMKIKSGSDKIHNLRIMKLVIVAMLIKEAKGFISVSRLGYFWIIVEPLGHLTLMVFIFTYRLSGTASINYPVFLTVGVVPYFMFKDIHSKLTTSINSDVALLSFKRVKPIDILISKALFSVILHGVLLIMLLCGLIYYGYDVTFEHLAAFVGVFIMLALFGFALGTLFCVMHNKMEKLPRIINITSLPIYILSAVIFPISSVSTNFQYMLLYNPLIHLIETGRHCLLPNYTLVYGINLTYPSVIIMVLLFLSLFLYYYRSSRLVEI